MKYKRFTIEDIKDLIKMASDRYKVDATSIPIKVIDYDEINAFAGFEAEYSRFKIKGREKCLYIKAKCFYISDVLLEYKLPVKFVEHIVLHEYCHYFTNSENRIDCDHNKIFKYNCSLFGIPRSEFLDLDEYLEDDCKYGNEVFKYTIKCTKCGFSWDRKRIGDIDKFESEHSCPKCKIGDVSVIKNF